MSIKETRSPADNWYVRMNAWSNRMNARLLVWLAIGVSGLGRLLPVRARARMENMARFCRNLAGVVDRPEIARRMASPSLLAKSMIETASFSFLLTLVTTWTLLSVFGLLTIDLLPVLLLVLLLSLVFAHLLYLLAISGDVYQRPQDESQRQSAHQASADTLRVVMAFLVMLSLILAFVPAWRVWAALDLGALLLVARLVYLTRLAQLRWTTLALIEMEDESEIQVEER